MNFTNFGKFFRNAQSNVEEIAAYLDKVNNKTIDDLNSGLKSLRFEDNFQCQRLSIPGVNKTTAVKVNHSLDTTNISWIVANGIAGVLITTVDKRTINVVLDSNVYSGTPTYAVEILLFK